MKQKSANTVLEFSVYDLNIAKTLKIDFPKALNSESITTGFEKESFLSQTWKIVEMYCRDRCLDYDAILKSPPDVPLIIDSTHHLYFQFLETALMFYEPPLIKYFLTYQFNNFKGNVDAKNKEAFLGQVLFVIYPNIESKSPNNNLYRREKIFDWLETHNIENLPERLSKQNPSNEDNRYKGRLTPEEVSKYWMQLCNYNIKSKVVEVLNEFEIQQFLQANFWGFGPQMKVEKLDIKNISQAEFRKFSKDFFDKYSESNRTRPFIKILKDNFSIFDDTSEENLTKNFRK